MSDDEGRDVGRRTVLRGAAGLGGIGLSALVASAELPRADPAEIQQTVGQADPHTVQTFAAAVDAVVPRTPTFADDDVLGPEHVPGGVDAGVHEYFVTYVNTLFDAGLPGAGPVGNLRLAEVVATLLDEAAGELLSRGMNRHPPGSYEPSGEHWPAGGPFARLHPEDRIRALALFDEADKEFDSAALPGPIVEGDAGIIAQLVVAFPEVIYYSEWQGYADLTDPPSERTFDPDAVQSWTQTDFPGFRDGYAAHRGYVAGSTLGDGPVWRRASGRGWALRFTERSGDFVDNDDYESTDYSEHVPTPISGSGDDGAAPPGGDTPGNGAGGPRDRGPGDGGSDGSDGPQRGGVEGESPPDGRGSTLDVDIDVVLGGDS